MNRVGYKAYASVSQCRQDGELSAERIAVWLRFYIRIPLNIQFLFYGGALRSFRYFCSLGISVCWEGKTKC